MIEQQDRDLLTRGVELLGLYDIDVVNAISIDHNYDLSSIAATTAFYTTLPEGDSANAFKSLAVIAFYLGYLAGKEEGNLSLWEDQL